MQVFNTYRKIYFINELKSWALTLVLVLILFFIIRFFTSSTERSFLVGITLLVLLKLRDFIVPFHVKQVKIDVDNKRLIFLLKSIISGEKIKTYNLDGTKSELIEHSGLESFFLSPVRIRIITSAKERFEINSRYGFPAHTLKELDKAIRNQSIFSLD